MSRSDRGGAFFFVKNSSAASYFAPLSALRAPFPMVRWGKEAILNFHYLLSTFSPRGRCHAVTEGALFFSKKFFCHILFCAPIRPAGTFPHGEMGKGEILNFHYILSTFSPGGRCHSVTEGALFFSKKFFCRILFCAPIRPAGTFPHGKMGKGEILNFHYLLSTFSPGGRCHAVTEGALYFFL